MAKSMVQKRPSATRPMQRPQPIANVTIKQERIDAAPNPMVRNVPSSRQPNVLQRPMQNANVVVKQEIDDLSEYVQGNGKYCYTCKKNVGAGGLSAKNQNKIAHFCNTTCFSRAGEVRPPETVTVKREMMQDRRDAADAKAKFYCEVCDKSYTLKDSLRRHFVSAHPGHYWNSKIVAQDRSHE